MVTAPSPNHTSINPPAENRVNTLILWSVMLFAAALAWVVTVPSALKMGHMPGTMGMNPVSFIIMWSIMMAAMMLPSLAPVASLYLRVLTGQANGLIRVCRITGFVTGYLLVWAAFGVVAYATAWLINLLLRESPEAMLWTSAAILLSCGVYQLTPFKELCLNHCRSPLGFLFHFGNYTGMFKDLRVGLYHGGYCTGCCFGLMIVMIFAGVMNLAWMIALAAIIFIEKVWRYGKEFSYVTGLILIVLGCLLPWHPYLLNNYLIR